jgi:hypothetical protein
MKRARQWDYEGCDIVRRAKYDIAIVSVVQSDISKSFADVSM